MWKVIFSLIGYWLVIFIILRRNVYCQLVVHILRSDSEELSAGVAAIKCLDLVDARFLGNFSAESTPRKSLVAVWGLLLTTRVCTKGWTLQCYYKKPLFTPRSEHSLLFIKREGLHPCGPTSPLGSNFAPRGRIKACPMLFNTINRFTRRGKFTKQATLLKFRKSLENKLAK
jgi:hypothetical protein